MSFFKIERAYNWLDSQQRRNISYYPEKQRILSYDVSNLPPLFDYGHRSTVEISQAFCYLFEVSPEVFGDFECEK